MSLSAPSPDDLRAFRKAVGGWSQVRFAEELGVSRRNVEDWEAGRSSPPVFLRLAMSAIDANLKPWPEK